MTMGAQLQKIPQLLEDCANQYIVPRYKNLAANEINAKTHENDLVTVADIETEDALCRILPQMFPGCAVIGEEGVSRGTASLDTLKNTKGIIFVLDPVDGTYNFRHGRREFAVMMAMIVDGKLKAGWIYDVLGKTHYTAAKGEGAFMNGQRINVCAPKDVARPDARGFMEVRYMEPDMRAYAKANGADRFPSLYCAAHEYLNIASGKADFAVFSHMKPWDHLAGSLLVREAGGLVDMFNGQAYSMNDSTGGIIVATHPDVYRQVKKMFLDPTGP